MNRSKIWLGLSVLSVVVAALATGAALLSGEGESPSADIATLTSSSAVVENPDVQSGKGDVGGGEKEMVEAVPETRSIITPPSVEAAPDFLGIVQWINSPPLSLRELQGKVVLVDFWTYSCINCQRTLPYVGDWYEKYGDQGLVVVGVHSPEFPFEEVEANVREALVRQEVTWPVAMDNDFKTWRAYENRWWPHKFLIDKDGLIRYHHIGEGTYEETELHIRNLLTEAGHDVSEIPVGRHDQ